VILALARGCLELNLIVRACHGLGNANAICRSSAHPKHRCNVHRPQQARSRSRVSSVDLLVVVTKAIVKIHPSVQINPLVGISPDQHVGPKCDSEPRGLGPGTEVGVVAPLALRRLKWLPFLTAIRRRRRKGTCRQSRSGLRTGAALNVIAIVASGSCCSDGSPPSLSHGLLRIRISVDPVSLMRRTSAPAHGRRPAATSDLTPPSGEGRVSFSHSKARERCDETKEKHQEDERDETCTAEDRRAGETEEIEEREEIEETEETSGVTNELRETRHERHERHERQERAYGRGRGTKRQERRRDGETEKERRREGEKERRREGEKERRREGEKERRREGEKERRREGEKERRREGEKERRREGEKERRREGEKERRREGEESRRGGETGQ
jgi:hypothetical protein